MMTDADWNNHWTVKLEAMASELTQLRAKNARLRRLSVRVFEDCGECESRDRSIPVARSALPCAACGGKGRVLRDGAYFVGELCRSNYDKYDRYVLPASWMEAE